MIPIQSALHRHQQPEPVRPGNSWPWPRSAGFVLLSCGLFWAAVIALLWSLL